MPNPRVADGKMAEGGEDLSKVSGGGGGGKEDPDPKTQHAASAKSGKKVGGEKIANIICRRRVEIS